MSLSISRWKSPPQNLNLVAGQLHLWRIPLALSNSSVKRLKYYLCSDELKRAERLLIPEKRLNFIIARGRLRQLLALYLDKNPAEINFDYGAHGKPALAVESESGLFFNLSHSAHWALLALTRSGEVGVDLEQMDNRIDYITIAEQFFSPQELHHLHSFARERQRRVFYRLWTLKEARLKAFGGGFSAVGTLNLPPSGGEYRTFPVASNYLASVFYQQEITSVLRYQPTEI